MPEIIVKAERTLYTDEEWFELLEDSEVVVRCKDCAHWDALRYLTDNSGVKFCGVWYATTKFDGYCHRARKRNNGR